MHEVQYAAHPLILLRRLVDQALDDLGGVVAASESPDADGLPRRSVRLVLLQVLCGLRSDVAFAQHLNGDGDSRVFVGSAADDVAYSAADCARARHCVLGIAGFAEFLGVLLDALARRNLLTGAMFAPDRGLLQSAQARGAMLAPAP